MRRGPNNIPLDNLDRTIEYLEGGPGYESLLKKGHFLLKVRNLVSYVLRPYHFEDIEDFEAHKFDLHDGADVAFDSPLTVVKNENIDKKRVLSLEDRTGLLKLVYPYHVELIDGIEFPPHPFNDPIYGAENGDSIRIYSSTFTGGDLETLASYFVRNDEHYQRVAQEREEICKKFGI